MTKQTKNWLTFLDIALYATLVLAIELSKTWNLVGTERLRHYDFYDWLVECVGTWAVAGVVIKAYFDKSLGSRQDEVENTQQSTETK